MMFMPSGHVYSIGNASNLSESLPSSSSLPNLKLITATATVKSRMCGKILCLHILLLLFIFNQLDSELMVTTTSESCNASGCFWEKGPNDTAKADPRGLSRHRATCQHYRKSRYIATQKRLERARQAAARCTVSPSPVPPKNQGSASSSVSRLFLLES